MPKKRSFLTILSLLALAWFFPASHAHAYLDPGTGSYAIQIIIGVVFGAGYVLKTSGGRIVTFLKSLGRTRRQKKNNHKDV